MPRCIICGSKPQVFKCPKHEGSRKRWLDFCGIKDQNASIRLCPSHFESHYFFGNDASKRTRLLRVALPTLNPPKNPIPSPNQSKVMLQRRRIVCALCGNIDKTISYFNFPKNEERRKQWLDICRMKEISKGRKLCAKHFSAEDIIRSMNSNLRTVLRYNAVPKFHIQNVNQISDKTAQHSSISIPPKKCIDIGRLKVIDPAKLVHCYPPFNGSKNGQSSTTGVPASDRPKITNQVKVVQRFVPSKGDKNGQSPVTVVRPSDRSKLTNTTQVVQCVFQAKSDKSGQSRVTVVPLSDHSKITNPSQVVQCVLQTKSDKNGQSSVTAVPLSDPSKITNPVQVVQCILPAKGDKDGQPSMTVVPPKDTDVTVGQKVVLKYVTQEYINQLIQSNKDHLSRIKQLEDENKSLRHKLSTIQALSQTNSTSGMECCLPLIPISFGAKKD